MHLNLCALLKSNRSIVPVTWPSLTRGSRYLKQKSPGSHTYPHWQLTSGSGYDIGLIPNLTPLVNNVRDCVWVNLGSSLQRAVRNKDPCHIFYTYFFLFFLLVEYPIVAFTFLLLSIYFAFLSFSLFHVKGKHGLKYKCEAISGAFWVTCFPWLKLVVRIAPFYSQKSQNLIYFSNPLEIDRSI